MFMSEIAMNHSSGIEFLERFLETIIEKKTILNMNLEHPVPPSKFFDHSF